MKYRKEEMIEMCEGDEQCLYDTAALGSLEVGKQTRDAHRYYRLVHENMKSGKIIDEKTIAKTKLTE